VEHLVAAHTSSDSSFTEPNPLITALVPSSQFHTLRFCFIMSSNKRCTCSAIFATNDDLEAHFEEQTFLKVALEKTKASVTAALDRCSAHAAAKIENTQDGNDTSTAQGRHCPYAGCTRRDAFAKRKELRIHFRQRIFNTPARCL
jgi:hypothetical protein